MKIVKRHKQIQNFLSNWEEKLSLSCFSASLTTFRIFKETLRSFILNLYTVTNHYILVILCGTAEAPFINRKVIKPPGNHKC